MAFNTQDPRLIGSFTLAPQELNPGSGHKLLIWNPQISATEHVDWSQLPSLAPPDFGTGAIVGTLEATGDGVKSSWTLPVTAVDKANIEVVLDGLEDRSFTYNPLGPTISFTNPLPSGVALYVRIFGGQTSSTGVLTVAGKTGNVTLSLNDITSGVTTNRLIGNTSGSGILENINIGAGLTLAGGVLGTQLNADQIADGNAKVMMTIAERQAVASIGATSVWQDPVINRTATPPGSPTTGDRYIVAPSGTGAWSGHDNDIATWGGSSWSFTTPSPGWVAMVTTLGTPYVFGNSVWAPMGGAVQSVFGRAGAIVATSGDYTAAQITETTSAKIMTDAERTKLAGVEAGATAAGGPGDAFATSHAGATGSAHGAATTSVAGFMSSGDKTKLDAATAAATVSTLAMRDANGRLAVATPTASGEAATKGYVDGLSFPATGNSVILPTTKNQTITNSTTPTICWQWTIPANYLTNDGDLAQFDLCGSVFNNSGTDKTYTIKIELNSVALMEDVSGAVGTAATNVRSFYSKLRIWRASSSTARADIDGKSVSNQSANTTGIGDYSGNGVAGSGLATAETAPSGISWSSSQTLAITITLSAADANFTFKSFEGTGNVPRQAGGIFALDSAAVAALTDNTNNNVSTSAHGFAPKAPNDALFKALSVQSGTISWSEVSTSGGGEGTTLDVYADDPTFGANDDVAEVYLGKRITLPAYSAGKRNRITVVNTGLSTSLIRANATASVVQGCRLAAQTADRFVSSVNAPASIGNKMTISTWLRVNSDTTSYGVFHIGNGGTDGTASWFRLSATYATSPWLQVESQNASTKTVLRRYAFTRGIAHHVVISIDLSVPSLVVAIDGQIVTYDAGQSGTTLTSAQPIGGSNMPIRWLSQIPSVHSGFSGSCGQFTIWLDSWASLTEQRIRGFYNDGPVDITTTTQVNSTNPWFRINALPTGSPAVATNTGSLGGTLTDSFGSGVNNLDMTGPDTPMLEQIDGYPTGYSLPVGNEVRLIRRKTKGVWGIF